MGPPEAVDREFVYIDLVFVFLSCWCFLLSSCFCRVASSFSLLASFLLLLPLPKGPPGTPKVSPKPPFSPSEIHFFRILTERDPSGTPRDPQSLPKASILTERDPFFSHPYRARSILENLEYLAPSGLIINSHSPRARSIFFAFSTSEIHLEKNAILP